MKLDLILTENTNDLTDSQKEFVNLHTKLCKAVVNATMGLYEMSKIIKEIYDTKLYMSVGYSTLEEYTEEYFGLKKSQAYNYITIAGKYSLEFFQLIGKNVGMTKLLLLSKLGEDGAFNYITENDVENVSVNELKQEIKNLEDKLKSSEALLDVKTEMLEVEIKENDKKVNIIKQLQLDIEALQSDPAAPEIREVIKEVPIVDEAAVKELEEKNKGLEEKISKLEDKIKKTKNSNKDINELVKEKEAVLSELEELRKKYELSSNNDFNDFKAQFNLLKKIYDDMILKISGYEPEFKEKCFLALKQLFRGVLTNE